MRGDKLLKTQKGNKGEHGAQFTGNFCTSLCIYLPHTNCAQSFSVCINTIM